MKPPTVLFVCTGNAGRSQMAEALFRHLHGARFEPFSAGVDPWPALHPMACRLMAEQGLDLARHFPKHVSRFADAPLDAVVTIGDRARAETCPFRAEPVRIHWAIPDPADADGTPDLERVFRVTRQAILDRFPELVRILENRTLGPKPAICTTFDCSIPFDRCLGLIRDAGFGIVSVGGRLAHADYMEQEGRTAIRRALAARGLTAESLHAPFPEGDRLFSVQEAERQESLRLCRGALEAAAELGGPIVVIHLIQPYGIPPGDLRDRMIEQGRRSVEALAAEAARRGVKLALENGQKQEYDQVLADFLSLFPSDPVGFCYDSGHENVQGGCFRLLERFGQRLQTVHLHDNSGTDTHVLPFEGTIPWESFPGLLRRLPYAGNLLLEADLKHSGIREPAAFLAQAMERVRRLGARP